jgi:hypothetical protein
VLEHFTARELLYLACLSSRTSNLIAKILHQRIAGMIPLKCQNIVLRIFDPNRETSLRLTYDYLKADCQKDIAQVNSLISFTRHYSYFAASRHQFSQAVGQIGETTSDSWVRNRHILRPVPDIDSPQYSNSQTITLAYYQPFYQLCISTYLVNVNPVPPAPSGCVAINEGVIRLRRGWLAAQHTNSLSSLKPMESSSNNREGMAWVDGGTRVGLYLVVKEESDFSIRTYEDESIAYTLQHSSKKHRHIIKEK